jgi:hypothetical protein
MLTVDLVLPDDAINAQHAEVLGPDVDRVVWENQIYRQHAPFRKEERTYVSFRRWARQFYPHEEERLHANGATAEPLQGR